MSIVRQWPMYLIGRMLPAAIGFCGIALYTRAVDPAAFGTYAMLLSASFLIGMVCFTWLRVAALRTMSTVEAADEPDFAATILVSFLGTALFVACISLIALALAVPHVPFDLQLLTAAAAIASGWFELNVTVVQARMQVVAYGTLQAARAVTALASSLILIALGLKARALLGGFVIGNCVGLGVLPTWRPALGGRFRLNLFRQLFAFGWPSSASGLTYFSITFQRFVLSGTAGTAAVGIFAAASDFSQQTIGLLMGTVLIAGQPLAFRARDRGAEGDLTAQLRSNARLLFTVGLGACAALIALSVPIAHLYFGAKFQTNAGLILAISAAAMFMSAFRGNYFEQTFEIARDTRPLVVLAVLRTLLTIVLTVMLLPHLGAIGAALATLIAEFVGLGVSAVWSGRLMYVPVPLRSFAKVSLATGAMMGVMAYIPSRPDTQGLALAVVAGLIVYTVVFMLVFAREVGRLIGPQHALARWLMRS